VEVRITVFVENSVIYPFDVIGEHGFSVFVEMENFSFLFDTGQGKALVNNALALKVLREYDIEKLGASHCTGLSAARLFGSLKEKFFFASVGAVLEV